MRPSIRLNPKPLIHFCKQAPKQPQEAAAASYREREAAASLPQWYLARDHPARLFLVFRGTASDDDVIRDLMATPAEAEHGGLRFHGGFLSGVQGNDELHAQLMPLLDPSCGGSSSTSLYIMGHSLGGSLGLVVPLIGGLLPSAHAGALTVVALGSPPVLHAGTLGVDQAALPHHARSHTWIFEHRPSSLLLSDFPSDPRVWPGVLG